MRQRCYLKSDPYYHRYGARGIKVCKRWEDFDNFLKDMGKVPAGMTLERIDNNGGYKPSNCKWATKKDQANNTVRNRLFTFKGVTKSVTLWGEEYKIHPRTLYERLVNRWPMEKALKTKPLIVNQRYLTYQGIKLRLYKWAQRYGRDLKAVSRRLSRGWPVRRALETP